MKIQNTLKNLSKYRGSIVMSVDDKVYTTKDPKSVERMVKEIEKKHNKRPLITVVPKGDTWVFFSSNEY